MIKKVISKLLLLIVAFGTTTIGYCKNLILNDKPNMRVERTLSIIKPDAVKKSIIGSIETKFESAGLKIVAMRMVYLTKNDAEKFYAIHKNRPFFPDLVNFMSSGPVVVQVLEGVDAIAKNRAIMGATNPKEAESGTIRHDFADSIDANCVHGSDSLDNAITEIAFFFRDDQIYSR